MRNTTCKASLSSVLSRHLVHPDGENVLREDTTIRPSPQTEGRGDKLASNIYPPAFALPLRLIYSCFPHPCFEMTRQVSRVNTLLRAVTPATCTNQTNLYTAIIEEHFHFVLVSL